MSRDYSTYESPFCTRYASKEMQYIFSADKKFSTWRRLWVALARGEMKLGLPVTQEQVDELESHINDINYDVAEEREKLVRHDEGHNPSGGYLLLCGRQHRRHRYARRAAAGQEEAAQRHQQPRRLRKRAQGSALPCLHTPPAGAADHRRQACHSVDKRTDDGISHLKLLGQKGTTGTQASFVELFKGDSAKIKALEKSIAEEMGFDACVPVSGQTYSRKMDSQVLATLGGIAQSCSKFSNDLRILANFK